MAYTEEVFQQPDILSIVPPLELAVDCTCVRSWARRSRSIPLDVSVLRYIAAIDMGHVSSLPHGGKSLLVNTRREFENNEDLWTANLCRRGSVLLWR